MTSIMLLEKKSHQPIKTTLLSIVILTVISYVLSGCKSEQRPEKTKPNVMFIIVDDLRTELGCYGNSIIKTPNINALAKEGIVFTNTYCQVSVCAPSRASVMTGLRPDSNHVWHLGDKFRNTIPDVVTMPQYFHEYGYYTVSTGKIFHNHMPDSVSWDEPDLRPPKYNTKEMLDRDAETFYHDDETTARQKIARQEIIKKNPNAYGGGWNIGPALEVTNNPDTAFYDAAQTDLAIETIKRIKDYDQPFYYGLGYFRPHLPFVVPQKYWDMYKDVDIPLAPNPYLPKGSPVYAIHDMYELRNYWGFQHIGQPWNYQVPDDTARLLKRGYYSSVSYTDAQIGRLIQALKDMGLYENTIIILWGDHGWKLGEHRSWGKMTNYDNDTRVPLIIKAPGIKGGEKIDEMVELVDMFPTLLELSNIKVKSYLQGTSFVPLMKNPELSWKPAVFSQFHRRPNHSPDGKRYMGYSMNTKRYHYVEWHYWDNDKKIPGELTDIELFDHQNDPQENINIANLPENKKLVESLARELHDGWRAAIPKGMN
jgi:iduronate 2-sulfatase